MKILSEIWEVANFYNTDSCITIIDIQFYEYELVSLWKAPGLCIVEEPIGIMHIGH